MIPSSRMSFVVHCRDGWTKRGWLHELTTQAGRGTSLKSAVERRWSVMQIAHLLQAV